MMVGSRSRDGVALITSLGVVMVVSVLVVGAILTTQMELFVTRNDATSAQAQYVAQAGLQTYKAGLFQNFRWLEDAGSTGMALGDVCLNSLASGFDVNRNGSATPWSNNRMVMPQGQVRSADGDLIGTFQVTLIRDPSNSSRFTIDSIGRTVAGSQTRQATSTARATFVIRNSTVLEQAIFAGEGSGMRFVNGNTTIYGGVYIVGNRSDPDELVFESNGNFSIFNGYDKRPAAGVLGQFLVDQALRSNNLCAALRVESGRVAVGGSTQIGTPSQPLLTVAVGRGVQDIDTSRGGTLQCESNKGVCVESAVGPFDIAENPPDFPLLDMPPGTDFCGGGKTWRTCIREEAVDDGLVIANVLGTTSVVAPEGIQLEVACLTFLQNAAANSTRDLVFGDSSIDCSAEHGGKRVGFRYTVTGSNVVFETFGNINMRGFNMRFNRGLVYRAVSRTATGFTQPFSNLSVETVPGTGGGSISASGNFVADSAAGKFPNNVLTLVAERNVHLRGGNNTYVTAPIYAGEQFKIRGQTQLYGQVIANEFCTTNVQDDCSTAGTPAEIVFVPTGENRPRSFRAIAPTGGLPTFSVEVYELR